MTVATQAWTHNIALTKMIFWREFNAMYRRTSLGPLWAFLAPVAYLCVFIFFRLLFGLGNPEGIPIIPFLFSGLSLWLLFSLVVTAAFPAILTNVSILKKIPTSPLIFVVAGSLLPLLTCTIYMLLLEGLLFYYGYGISIVHICIPLAVLLVYFFALGIGLLVATIAFYKQDIVQALPTLIQLGMFATPIFFSPSIIPEKLQWVIKINPVAECVGILRQAIFFNSWPDGGIVLKTCLIIAILWAVALPMFKRTVRYIADMY